MARSIVCSHRPECAFKEGLMCFGYQQAERSFDIPSGKPVKLWLKEDFDLAFVVLFYRTHMLSGCSSSSFSISFSSLPSIRSSWPLTFHFRCSFSLSSFKASVQGVSQFIMYSCTLVRLALLHVIVISSHLHFKSLLENFEKLSRLGMSKVLAGFALYNLTNYFLLV